MVGRRARNMPRKRSSCRSEFFLKDANRHHLQAYSFRGVNPHASHRSEMNTLRKVRKVVAIACIIPMAAFGVAACGGKKTGGGGGGGGGDINVALTSFPDYVDP